jgi:predicted transcriptional regulator
MSELDLTARIVSAYVSNNSVTAGSVSDLIKMVYGTLAGVSAPAAVTETREAAVPIKKSVFPDHIVCLDCARTFSSLKRHIRTDHGLNPDGYRTKWGLPSSYPMVAPDYSAKRSSLATANGLGRRAAPAEAVAGGAVAIEAPDAAVTTTRRKRTARKAA